MKKIYLSIIIVLILIYVSCAKFKVILIFILLIIISQEKKNKKENLIVGSGERSYAPISNKNNFGFVGGHSCVYPCY